MSASPRATGFFLGFLVVVLAVAGGLSYLASDAPDGLDTVTLAGCQPGEDGEPTAGTCIAQHAEDHALAGSPLADYALSGTDGTVGPAGVVGVVVTLLVAGGIFWALRGRGGRGGCDRRGGGTDPGSKG